MNFIKGFKQKNHTLFALSVTVILIILSAVFILTTGLGAKNNSLRAVEGELSVPTAQAVSPFDDGWVPTAISGEGDTAEYFELASTGSLNSMENPYLIKVSDDLRTLAYLVNGMGDTSAVIQNKYATASYRLENHIDLSIWSQWEPIGTMTNPFYGNFNGNGYSIYGLTIIDDSAFESNSLAGLFGLVSYDKVDDSTEYKPVIQRLGLKDTVIKTNREYSGSIVAYARGVDLNEQEAIMPSYTTISVEETPEGSSTPVNRLYSNATAAVIIEDCYNTGYIEGSSVVGGLVGKLESGAAVFNCYNAPMSTNEYNVEYDVYSNIEDGCVGGIAGYTEFNDRAVVYRTINFAQVAKLNVSNSSENIGYILGYKPTDASDLYRRVALYVRGDYTFSGDYGAGLLLSQLQDSSTLSDRGFSCTLVDPDSWANNVSTIWVKGSQANNGLPLLANVPQLVKFEYSAEDVNKVEIDSSLVSLKAVNNTGLTPANANFTLYEVGQEIGVSLDIIANEQYVFANTWIVRNYRNSVVPNPAEQTITSQGGGGAGVDAAYMFFTGNDCEIVAVEDFTTYTISVISNQESNISLDSVFTLNGEDEYAYSQIRNNSVTVTYNDILSMGINCSTGYQVDEVSSLYGNVSIIDGIYQLSIKDYLTAYKAAQEEGVESIPSIIQINIDLIQVDYELSLGTLDNSVDCTITAQVNEEPAVTLKGSEAADSVMVNYGDTVLLSLTLTDNERYALRSWTITYNGQEPFTAIYTGYENGTYTYAFTVSQAGPITIVPNFDKQSYSVSLIQSTGGNISVTQGTLVSGKYYFDDTVVVTANVSAGYEFAGFVVTKDGEEFEIGSTEDVVYNAQNRTITFNGLAANYTVQPVFNILSYTLNVSVQNADEESVENAVTVTNGQGGESILGENKFVYNTRVNLTVTANPGYRIINIVDESGTNYNSGYVVTISGDKEITITVEAIKYSVVVSTSIEGSASIGISNDSIIGTGIYTYGEEVVVYINVPSMFEFVRWEPENAEFENVVFDTDKVGFTCSGITSDIRVTAVFQPKYTRLTFDVQGAEGENVFTVDNQELSDNFADRFYMTNVTVRITNEYLTGENAKRYQFAYWAINGVAVSSNPIYTFTVGLGEMNVTAVFEPVTYGVNAYVVRWNPETNSYIELPNAGGIDGIYAYNYKYGDKLVLTESTNEGYRFAGWYLWSTSSTTPRGTFVTNENLLEFFIDGMYRVYANFEPVSIISAQVSDSAAGYVDGIGEYIEGQSLTLKAIVNEGYVFVNWIRNGQVVSESATYTLTVGANDEVLIAVFEPVFTISLVSSNDEYGQIIGNSSGRYHENITLQAISENNCSFVGWVVNDVIISTSTTLNLNVNGDIEVRALFKKNFDWNIIIILAGCVLFAIVLIAGSTAYIKMKEAEPMQVRVLLNSKDDKDALQKASRRDRYRDVVEPVPTRKNTKDKISPIPVRKITVAPINHKGELVKNTKTAEVAEPKLKTEVATENDVKEVKNPVANETTKQATKAEDKTSKTAVKQTVKKSTSKVSAKPKAKTSATKKTTKSKSSKK